VYLLAKQSKYKYATIQNQQRLKFKQMTIELQKFKNHYHTLQLDLHSDHIACKRAYKKLVNIWHPDKFTINTESRIKADEKIKSINIAYSCISEYYKKHNLMPGKLLIEVNEDDSINQTSNSFDLSSLYSHIKQKDKHKTDFYRNKNIQFIGVLITILFIFLILNVDDYNEQNTIQNSQTINTKTSQKNSKTTKLYFTKGSSINDVLDSQGTPSRTVGSKWYYKESWIEFSDGRVSDWFNSSKNTLNIEDQTINKLKNNIINHSVYKFSKYSSKSKVILTQGQPLRKTNNIWYYEISKVYFKNGRVDSWYNSPLDPLLVNE